MLEAGRLNPAEPADARRVIDAEYERRIFAFVFEEMAARALRATGLPVSTGWFVAYNDGGEPQWWFRLYMGDEKPNACDAGLHVFLRGLGCTVFTVRAVPGAPLLLARTHRAATPAPLDVVISRETGRHLAPVRCASNVIADTVDGHAAAMRAVEDGMTESRRCRLAYERFLMNVYLERWFPARAADVDAVALVGDRLHIIECKRKYPASNGTFGLDRQGVRLMNWGEWCGVDYVNLVLCSPVWDAGVRPDHLLGANSPTIDHLLWLALRMRSGMDVGGLRTVGVESGMHGGVRHQRAYRPDDYTLVGRGEATPELLPFLMRAPGLPRASLPLLQHERAVAATKLRSRVVA